jgi:hypothetical protein
MRHTPFIRPDGKACGPMIADACGNPAPGGKISCAVPLIAAKPGC